MRRQQKSGPAAKVKLPSAHGFDADVSEAFRRARDQVSQITTDLDALRRRTASAVKRPRRPAASK